MRSGDRPGLQNRRAAGYPVTGGFDSATLPQKSDCAPILVRVRLLPPVEAERLLVSSIILRRLNFDFDQQRSGLTKYCGKE